MLKRQRELQKAEKAAMKRARREGRPIDRPAEPTGSVIPRPGTPPGEANAGAEPEADAEAEKTD